MIKSKKLRINKDYLVVSNTETKTRNLVEYKCVLYYYSSKLVDSRTFKRHQ